MIYRESTSVDCGVWLIRTQVPEDEAGEVEEYAGGVEGEHLGGVLQAHLHHRLHHHHPHHQPVQGLAQCCYSAINNAILFIYLKDERVGHYEVDCHEGDAVYCEECCHRLVDGPRLLLNLDNIGYG